MEVNLIVWDMRNEYPQQNVTLHHKTTKKLPDMNF